MTTATPTRAWAAITAWGAGLIEIALGASALRQGDFPIRGAGVLLLLVGVAALSWGAVTLTRGRIVAPRAGVAGAIASLLILVSLFAMTDGGVGVAAVAAASALLIATSLACALTARSRDARTRTTTESVRSPKLLGIILAAVAVGGLVTPALGSTEAGILAPDHSEHSFVDTGHSH